MNLGERLNRPICPICYRYIWLPRWVASCYPAGIRTHIRCFLDAMHVV